MRMPVIGPFALLLLAIPILLVGEWLMRHVRWLGKSNIPASIIGGLLAALALLGVAEVAPGWVSLNGNTANPVWLWPVLPQWGLTVPRATDVERPLLILFFTCVGMNTSWRLAKQGGLALALFLGLAGIIAVVQAATGVVTAGLLGENPLMGLMTSIVSLMGGFGTVAGFAPEFEKAGLPGAAAIGVAAAAFGVVAAGLLAGLLGGRLVEKHIGVRDAKAPTHVHPPTVARRGFLAECRELFSKGRGVSGLFVALLVCMKLGAFMGALIQSTGATFPVYMGSLIVAAVVRNVHDWAGGTLLKSESADRIASVALQWLLTVVMIDLQLVQLTHAALPMLIILVVQVSVTLALVRWVVFRVMGRDYEAAVMSAGMIGFGLGATSNALASMRELAQRFGAAPRAFLIVPIVGAFLIDFVNAFVTTIALNFLR